MLERQRPFGKTDWQDEMAAMFSRGSTLRPRGWQRNEKKRSLSLFTSIQGMSRNARRFSDF
jgi:hypothetical protein